MLTPENLGNKTHTQKKEIQNNLLHHFGFPHGALPLQDKRNNVSRGDAGQRIQTFSYEMSKF